MPLRGKARIKSRLHDRADKLVRAVTLETGGRLIRRTPVDIGRARANWNIGIGDIDRSEDAEARDPSGRAALGRLTATALSDVSAGDRIFITNSVPYIGELERGHSKQAPQGFVKVTAAEMKRLVSRALASLASE